MLMKIVATVDIMMMAIVVLSDTNGVNVYVDS